MAQLLNLSVENQEDDHILREVKRRVWWSLYMIDRWSSAGLGLPRQFHDGVNGLRLPMDEVKFLQMDSDEEREGSTEWEPGLWARMITLVYRIHDPFTFCAVNRY